MIRYYQYFGFVLLANFSPVFAADTITIGDLVDQDKLNLEVRQQSMGVFVAKQPIVFEVEVATNRWFSRGARIVAPTIVGTVILPVDGLGINSTKRVDGITWATQTREITLYAQKEGQFRLPAIEVYISVNTEKYGEIEGTVFTRPLVFDVEIPLELRPFKDYIASQEVKLVNDLADKQVFAIGEAITQTITLVARGVPGMMLPGVERRDIDGLSIYRKPAQIRDESSRGTLTGIRTESFTYIFEQSGEYFFPEQKIIWWNLATQQSTELIIPSIHWQVSGEARSNQGVEKQMLFRQVKSTSIYFVVLGILLVIAACYRYRSKLWFLYKRVTRLESRQQRKAFLRATDESDYTLACQILFRIVNQGQGGCSLRQFYSSQPGKLLVLEKLFAIAYSGDPGRGSLGSDEVKTLLPKLFAMRKSEDKNAMDGNLKLNPIH